MCNFRGKMRRVIVFTLIIMLLASYVLGDNICDYINRKTVGVRIMSENSGFYDFYSRDGTVRYKCLITLRNDTNQEKSIKLRGYLPFDTFIGRLKTPVVRVLLDNGEEGIFTLPALSQASYTIEFVGLELGKYRMKFNHSLPWILCVETNNSEANMIFPDEELPEPDFHYPIA